MEIEVPSYILGKEIYNSKNFSEVYFDYGKENLYQSYWAKKLFGKDFVSIKVLRLIPNEKYIKNLCKKLIKNQKKIKNKSVHEISEIIRKVGEEIKEDTEFKKIMSFSPSGILISNGPGNPKKSEKTIRVVKKLMDSEMPIFGICLGNQILSLAAGGDTYKLKFGHRSQNQPCIEEKTGRCYITSQNHGFAVAPESLSKEWKPWFTNANDRTNEGIMHRSKPWISVQFHPEASPGPVDTEFIFDVFLGMIK